MADKERRKKGDRVLDEIARLTAQQVRSPDLGTIGPIEREGLFSKGLGLYADLLTALADRLPAEPHGIGQQYLFSNLVADTGAQLRNSGAALRDWSFGFSPIRATPSGGWVNPRVYSQQLVDVIEGLLPLHQVAKAVPGATRDAARDFAYAAAASGPAMVTRRAPALYHGSSKAFDEFDFDAPTEYVPQSQKGILWFSTSPDVARSYGPNLYRLEGAPKNPMVVRPKINIRSSGKGKWALHLDFGKEHTYLGRWFSSDDYPTREAAEAALRDAMESGAARLTSRDMARVLKSAREDGHDGVLFKSIDDAYMADVPTSDVYAVFGGGKQRAHKVP